MPEIILLLVLGSVFGSYLNVWVDRIPRKESIHYPSSHCNYCNHVLKGSDLIPIFSYFLLKGKCRYCGTSFSGRQAIIETLCSILFVLSYLKWGFTPMLFTMNILIVFLLALSLIDIDTMKLPTIIIFYGILLETIVKLYECIVTKNIYPLIFSIILCISTYFIGYFISNISSKILHKPCLGLGDVRLFAMIIFFITPNSLILIYIFITILILSLLFVLGRYFVSRSLDVFPFGPFISAGTLIVLYCFS